MTPVRAWRRELSAGLGAALIIPAALLAALAVLALAGGFARVGALKQALAGPPAPAIAMGAARRRAGRGSAGALLAAIPGAALAAPAAASRSGSRPAGSGRTSGPGATGVPRPHPHPVGTTGTRPTRTPPPTMQPTQPTQPTQPAQPNPPPRPTVVDKVVSAATSVTNQLPAPAGPVATSTLQAVGSTLDGVLPSLGQ